MATKREGGVGTAADSASSPLRETGPEMVIADMTQVDPKPGHTVWSFVQGQTGIREVIGEVTADGRMPAVELVGREKLVCQTTVTELRDQVRARHNIG